MLMKPMEKKCSLTFSRLLVLDTVMTDSIKLLHTITVSTTER